MHKKELDRLLQGAPGALLTLAHDDGHRLRVYLSRDDLGSPARLRAAWRAATGWEMPHHSQAEHDVLVRAMFALADLVARGRGVAA